MAVISGTVVAQQGPIYCGLEVRKELVSPPGNNREAETFSLNFAHLFCFLSPFIVFTFTYMCIHCLCHLPQPPTSPSSVFLLAVSEIALSVFSSVKWV
jgi:hypothetical protein